MSRYCANFSTFIPMSFVLGFYVTIVVNRWWEQYLAMPWPDPLAVFVSTNIHGNVSTGRSAPPLAIGPEWKSIRAPLCSLPLSNFTVLRSHGHQT